MPVNADKPHLWKLDIVQSVDLYNNWFMQFAPQAYRDTRLVTTKQVESVLEQTVNLTNITPAILRQGSTKQINIPIDVVVMPLQANSGELPLLIEASDRL